MSQVHPNTKHTIQNPLLLEHWKNWAAVSCLVVLRFRVFFILRSPCFPHLGKRRKEGNPELRLLASLPLSASIRASEHQMSRLELWEYGKELPTSLLPFSPSSCFLLLSSFFLWRNWMVARW
mmetsp:Transcript_6703/g.16807  ORF Transcript_6703/g.16807 Transcript_6703/m.16807 type:complete len:122 (+) Transcript_6703:1370-1735(+)